MKEDDKLVEVKIASLPNGKTIWYKGLKLGVTGDSLPSKYLKYNAFLDKGDDYQISVDGISDEDLQMLNFLLSMNF